MATTLAGSRLGLTASFLAAGSLALGGCATEDYVDQRIAEVNGRIDQTDAHLLAVDRRVAEIDSIARDGVRRADAAQASADAAAIAAQQAGEAAQAAASEAERANRELAGIKPAVRHLQSHHARRSWSERGGKKRKPRKATAHGGERG